MSSTSDRGNLQSRAGYCLPVMGIEVCFFIEKNYNFVFLSKSRELLLEAASRKHPTQPQVRLLALNSELKKKHANNLT